MPKTTSTRTTTTYVLLLESRDGETFGLNFSTRSEARDWEDANGREAVGLIRVVREWEALEMSR